MGTQRILFVHAHPDDEAISTGGTIALLTDAGDEVTVLTATRGELGEIVDPGITGDLAAIREGEIAAALAVLGVTDHRFLGSRDARWEDAEPRRYLDSGMQWGASGAEPLSEVAPAALTSAPFAEIAADIAMVIADIGADAVISYNERGGYGHPDHVLVGEAAARAAHVLGVPFYVIDAGGELRIDVSEVLERKRAALRAYRSQLVVGETDFAGANGEREPIAATESYRLVPADVAVDRSFAAQGLGAKTFILAMVALFGAGAGLVFAAASTSGPLLAGVALLVTAAFVAGVRLTSRSRVVGAVASVALLAVSTIVSVRLSVDPSLLWLVGAPLVAVAGVAVPQSLRVRTGKIAQ